MALACNFTRFHVQDMFNVFFSLAKDNIPLSAGQTTAAAAQAVQQALQPGSSAKDQMVYTVHRMARVRQRLMEPYGRLRKAVRQLRERYSASKGHNFLVRYAQLQKMIVEVIALEKQYWQLIDIPAQEVHETPQSYVLKVVGLIEQHKGPFEEQPPSKTGAIAQLLGTTLNLAEKTKEQSLFQALKIKSVDDLKAESERLFTELFTLIVRYQGLRTIVKDLCSSYQDARFYPIMPRYTLLKAMIKRVLRSAAVMNAIQSDDGD